MITREFIFQNRNAILAIARQRGAHDLRIFGSVARGDAREDSDIDLIVRFDEKRTLLDHAGLIGDFEDFFGTKVDVIDADGMQPRFREVIEREALPL